ncbi:MAG: hypothetical protein ACRD15_01350 [Vicinamibacterales bacterium]
MTRRAPVLLGSVAGAALLNAGAEEWAANGAIVVGLGGSPAILDPSGGSRW